MRVLSALLIAAVVLLAAPPALAQSRAATKKKPIGFRAYVIVENESLTASKTFEAVLGTSTMRNVGAGGDVINLWKGAFARVAVTQASKTGSRVFVDADQRVYSLNNPVTVTLKPVEIGGGWRFRALDKKGRIVPFAGATILWQGYQETSKFSDGSEDTDEIFKGQSVFGGVEIAIKFVQVGVEGVFRRVPKAFGAEGVAGAFSETSLGGGAIRVRFGIGFK